MERYDEIDSIICHRRKYLLIGEGNDDRTYVFRILIAQLKCGLCRHTLAVIKDKISVRINTFGYKRKVYLESGAAERLGKLRYFRISLSCQAYRRHIHDNLHCIDQVHYLKVRKALHTDTAVEILLGYGHIALEMLEDLALVLLTRFVKLRLLLRCKERRIAVLELAVVIPKIFVLFVCIGMVDAHLLNAIWRIYIDHCGCPRIGIIALIKANEFLCEFTHISSATLNVTQSAGCFDAFRDHKVADLKDIIGRECYIAKPFLYLGECACIDSALLAESGIVKATAVLNVANECASER